MRHLILLTLLMAIAFSRGYAQQFMIDTVYFAFDSDRIKEDDQALLDSMVNAFIDYPSYFIEIQGHTDSIGSEAYNQELSDRRAQAVADFLMERGVDSSRMQVEGFGTSKPVLPNDSYFGRTLNRRTDIAVVFATEEFFTGEDTIEEEVIVQEEVVPVDTVDTVYCDYRPFILYTKKTTYIYGPKNTEVVVRPNTFQTDQNQVSFELKELYMPSDIIESQMPTVSKKGPLETLGMIQVNATVRGRPLRLQAGQTIEVHIPSQEAKKEIALYNGVGGVRSVRRRKRDDGQNPSFNPVKVWTPIIQKESKLAWNEEKGTYDFQVEGIGRYNLARPLYHQQGTDEKDQGVDFFFKMKGKRFEDRTVTMMTGADVNTFIPLDKLSRRKFVADRVRYIDPTTIMVWVAIQYDDDDEPWLLYEEFTIEDKGKEKKGMIRVKLKGKFRRVEEERLEEVMTNLDV